MFRGASQWASGTNAGESPIHILIWTPTLSSGPSLDRSTIDTDRADNTILIVLDPVAIFDNHFFRFGDPVHTYSIKAIAGLLQDEETGTRYASEVTLIR